MRKKIVHERLRVHDSEKLDLDGTLDQAISELENLKLKYSVFEDVVIHIDIETESDYYGESYYSKPYARITRLETQEEFDKRVNAEESLKRLKNEEARTRRKKAKDAEIALFKKLKAKYGHVVQD